MFCLLTLIGKFLFEDFDLIENFVFGTVNFGLFIDDIRIIKSFFGSFVKYLILFKGVFDFLHNDVSIWQEDFFDVVPSFVFGCRIFF
jgi:hypothetical protein